MFAFLGGQDMFRAIVLGSVVVLAFGQVAEAKKIYWTKRHSVWHADVDGSHVEALVTIGLSGAKSIAVAPTKGRVYWTDFYNNKIQRANLDGTDVEDVVVGLSSPYGLALDLDAGIMYWTNSGESAVADGTIKRADLDGANIEHVLTAGLVDPRGIALDVNAGKMYWADGAAIRRANLDGSGVEDLIDLNMGGAAQVALDLEAGKVYWAGAIIDSGHVGRANLDGSYEEILVSIMFYPIQALVLDPTAGYMYFGDGSIVRSDLDGHNRMDLVAGTGDIFGLALGPTAIPTTSEWGLLTMSLLILSAGTVVLVRRRVAV